jgi:hypothetical protein
LQTTEQLKNLLENIKNTQSETTESNEQEVKTQAKAPVLIYQRKVSEWSLLSSRWEKQEKETVYYKKLIRNVSLIAGLIFIVLITRMMILNHQDHRTLRSVEVLQKTLITEAATQTTHNSPDYFFSGTTGIDQNSAKPLIRKRPKPWQHQVTKPVNFQISPDEIEAQEEIRKHNENNLIKIYSIH